MNLTIPQSGKNKNGKINSLLPEDQAVHGWYRFVLSFPPHLVRQYSVKFGLGKSDVILDPFCGTGTTLVEAKKNEITSVGCDAHPFTALVSRVKTDWSLSAATLRRRLSRILKRVDEVSFEFGLERLSFEALMIAEEFDETRFVLSEDENKILPTGFLSSRPLKRLLILRDAIETQTATSPIQVREFFYVALAHTVSNGAGNFAFGPEIYRTKPKSDYDVLGHFARQSDSMIQDVEQMQDSGLDEVPSQVFLGDAREMKDIPDNVSAVITSPPYPNEKDYTRTTRVESILLRLLTDKIELRQTKEALLRSNTRNVFVNDDDSDEVLGFSSIQNICKEIERRRIEMGKTSGFERLYHKVAAHYFGGMRKHLRALRPKVTKKAKLAYVVGDQFSFLMVPIPTANLLGEVAESEGYRVVGCDLWRERVGTKVKNDSHNRKTIRVREEVLILEPR